jgi:sarcosine oxidase, subunit alpha
MTGDYRTPSGGRIDRGKPIGFTFDGKHYSGFAGDTLASALLANGVHLMGRSFKYHRPRGVLALGSEEPNALVGIGSQESRFTPNLRATQVEIYEGLAAVSQNNWPSLTFDLQAVNGLFSSFIPAGFYYKTFMHPKGAWEALYEPLIRRAAGLGRAPRARDADHYANLYAHCDVAIVGAGPAGLAAALASARGGARVMLFDEQVELGGSLLAENDARIGGQAAADWLAAALAELKARANVTLLPRTQIFGYYTQNFLAGLERVSDHLGAADPKLPRERLWQVRAKRVVLATGAHERPLVFPDNDRPGIMLAASARGLLARYGVKPGARAAVATAHDWAYRTALELQAAGLAIAAIVDLRPHAEGEWPQMARKAGLRVEMGATLVGSRGRLRVTHALVAKLWADGTAGPGEAVPCDLIAMSGGWTPSVHLFSQSRGKLKYDDALQAFVPDVSAQAERSAGACRGIFTLADVFSDGAAAGAAAIGAPPPEPLAVEGAPGAHGGFLGLAPAHGDSERSKSFVDFQNDVTARDVIWAAREGMRSIEHIKRYTTTGMATDQGKTSNMNALAIAADALGKTIPQVGLTTFRLPYTPVTFAAFVGMSRRELFDPIRQTPMHSWAEENGATFEEAGLWKRASYFKRPGEDVKAAVARECLGTRGRAGMMDASTLGKIEIVGPDAAEFLNRLFVNSFAKLAVGRCRYALMLNEAGYVMDDGVVARLAQDRFHVTTTSVGAAHVMALMEDFIQTEWPDLKVWFTSTTEQWATIAINGPRARAMLEPLVEGIDLSAPAMPNMSMREGRICGVPTRLARVSFTGELGFEVNVPSDYGRAIWEAIWAEGRKVDCVVYGLDVLLILRAEKGFIVVGQETDGTVTPDDLGLGKMVAQNKPDFIGKRSLAMADLARAGRKQLVGLLPDDPNFKLDEGAQVVEDSAPIVGTPALGHVTSSYFSPTLGRTFAMALVAGGRERMGASTFVTTMEGTARARVVEPIFYDREGKRLDG